jgi:hypothetical protein
MNEGACASANSPLTPALLRLDRMFEPLAFTRRGGLPETACVLRSKLGLLWQIACFKSATETRSRFASEHFASVSRKFCCTAIMKRPVPKNWRAKLISVLFVRLTLQNWRAKLISLLIATMLWYLIKKNVATTPSPSERSSVTPITETR